MGERFDLSTSDRERMERTAKEAAYWRDQSIAEAERLYAFAVKAIRERFEAELAAAEAARKRRHEAAFQRMERAQDATWNFIQTKNAKARIAQFGLDLPWLDSSNDMLRAAQDQLRVIKRVGSATN